MYEGSSPLDSVGLSVLAHAGNHIPDEASQTEVREEWDMNWLEEWPNSPHRKRVEAMLWKPNDTLSDQLRGRIWMKLSRAEALKEKSHHLYSRLLEGDAALTTKKNISADISRSFPNVRIRQAVNNPVKREQLRNVLTAYSNFDPKVDYCQGMNFIVAMLLVYLDEEDAFWVLVNMMQFYGIGDLCRKDMPVLTKYLDLFPKLLVVYNPKVAKYLQSLDFTQYLYFTEWITTLFVYRLGHQACVKVWDLFFLYGQEILFRVSLALLSTPPLISDDFFTIKMENMVIHFRDTLSRVDPAELLPKTQSITLPKTITCLLDDGIQKEKKLLDNREEQKSSSDCIIL